MHWEVIKFAADNNISKYNFGGLGISSIDKFKRSFGGYEVGYSRYIWMKQYINLLFKMLIWVKSNLIMPLTMLLKGR